MDEDTISNRVIGSVIEVHKQLGPGLLESAYETCLEYQLQKDGLKCARQKEMSIKYDGLNFDAGYRLDLVVEGKVLLN